MSTAFFITVPHSGERVPVETPWLLNLKEEVLMCDVDRYVDRLYSPVIQQLGVFNIMTEWHRYAADLNRLPTDLDELSVEGAEAEGRFSKGIGLHWAKTTKGDVLMPEPMSFDLHEQIVKKYHQPFHDQVEATFKSFFDQGHKKVYQLDAHSMPSLGTQAHPDPGELRAEIVISDLYGKSCSEEYKDLIVDSYKKAGFDVKYNWPYKGGRVTELYGSPENGQHTIQVELNRKLYMDEESKQILSQADEVSRKISLAVGAVLKELQEWDKESHGS